MSNKEVQIEESWKTILSEEFSKEYLIKMREKLMEENLKYTIYPPGPEIFSAFNHTPFYKIKVVIIGQDPYHGEGQANGLCFSVKPGISHPPSLINILKEIEQDLGIPYPKSGDLTPWADQGVLLLNATLTVRKAEANSHQKIGWQKFTDAVIQKISEENEHVIFLLWGGFAKKKGAKIDKTKHHVLTSGHPSPLSANRGLWFGNKHFSQCNELLKQMGKEEIDWCLE